MQIPVLSYNDLRHAADSFLEKYWVEQELPVPIEQIIELQMGIDITCLPSLQVVCGVDAFVSQGCDTIYVDGGVYLSPNEHRLRFSLAHELAHILIHRDVITQLAFNTMSEWKRVQMDISEEDTGWLEYQAHSLAGLILVPTSRLKEHHQRLSLSINAQHPQKPEDFIRAQIDRRLSTTFRVSTQVVQRRCSKEQL